ARVPVLLIPMSRRLPIIFLLWLLADLYFYQALRTVMASNGLLWCYWFLYLLLMVGIISTIFLARGSRLQQTLFAWLMGAMLLLFIPRLFSLPVLLVEDITR